MKKFEEGIFSDLRNLKPGVDASLEEPKVSLFSFFLGDFFVLVRGRHFLPTCMFVRDSGRERGRIKVTPFLRLYITHLPLVTRKYQELRLFRWCYFFERRRGSSRGHSPI